MPRMCGRACMQPYRIFGAVFFPRGLSSGLSSLGWTRYRLSPLWKAIKTLPTLPQVRIFAWRLGYDCLPIGSRVLAVGLGSSVCPFCSLGVETSLHSFYDCSDAIEALHLGGFLDSVITSRTSSIFDWLFETAESLSRENFAKFLLPVWVTVTMATLLHEDFIAANGGLKKPGSKLILSSPTWPPPPPRTVVISVDGAFIQDHGAGIGMVARDSCGRVLGGLAQY
ncbi:hypothetical protein V6N11_079972 [Hibiscus sabdariffa]|uniref:Reverse transcriptase zinc-binding domain-containing protein n=1 Tax=Hibiscus sabdariffa TaxID=183260 RepID=A0ABR2RWX4_9ROSI